MSASKVRPPEKDDSKLILLTIILVVLAVAISIPAYFMIEGFSHGSPKSPSHAGIHAEVTSNTTAEVTFAIISTNPPITKLEIELILGANSSIYSFESTANWSIASLDSGLDVGTITYWDRLDNEEVNLGDKLLLTNLNKDSDYTLYLIWAPNGEVIEQEDFTTPE